jgi:hypothetical protein
VPFTSELNTPGEISQVCTAEREKKDKNNAWKSLRIMFKNVVSSCILHYFQIRIFWSEHPYTSNVNQ